MRLTDEFINKMNEYISQKLINVTRHPKLPISLYKYSRVAQYSKTFGEPHVKEREDGWDEVLMTCRGLVLDDNYNIIAKPYSKFFNVEEVEQSDIDKRSHLKYNIEEKLDGSMIILFNYNDQWITTTQGNFLSEQAKMARNYIKDFNKLNMNHQYILELVSPLNMIVVKYDYSDLVLLSVRDVHNDFKELDITKNNVNFNIVPRYNHLDLKTLKALDTENKEGFVVKYEDGFMYKVKFAEYVRLHGLMTNLSEKHIMQSLIEKTYISDIVENAPDEYYAWLKVVENKFNNWYNDVYDDFKAELDKVKNHFNNEIVSKKELALYLNQNGYKHFKILIYKYYDGDTIDKMLDKYIWGLVDDIRKADQIENGLSKSKSFFSLGMNDV